MAEFLTPAEVAERLRVERPVVYKLFREKRLLGVRVNRKTYRIAAASVDALALAGSPMTTEKE